MVQLVIKLIILFLLALSIGFLLGWLLLRLFDAKGDDVANDAADPEPIESDGASDAERVVDLTAAARETPADEPEPVGVSESVSARKHTIVDSVDDSAFAAVAGLGLSAAARPGSAEGAVGEPAHERDDLKEIFGIGPKLEKLLNDYGIFTFRQLAELSDPEVAELQSYLTEFPGRIVRDDWVGQAQRLIEG